MDILLNPATGEAFLDEADMAWLDAADQHGIPYAVAEVVMLENLIADAHLTAPEQTRAYVEALLDLLDARGGADMTAEKAAYQQHGEALVEKLTATFDAEIVTTILPGARLQ